MEIEYYSSRRGDSEIINFILSLPDDNHKKTIINQIDLLAKYGPFHLQKTKDIEKIGKNLFELKCHYGKTIYRILFGIINYKIYIVVIFNKKDQKIKKRYINLALKRLKLIN